MAVFSLIVESDASLLRWEATCDGHPAQGQWSPLEVSRHINYLELLPAFYGLQTFANAQHIHVQLKLDNSTANSYLSNMGGIKSDNLNSLVQQLWELMVFGTGYFYQCSAAGLPDHCIFEAKSSLV